MLLLLFHGNILSNPFCQAIHSVKGAVFILKHKLKQPLHKADWVYFHNIWRVFVFCFFIWGKQLGPYFFKVFVFSAELVAVFFAWRVLTYAAILSWWMCLFDQSKRSNIAKPLRWDIFYYRYPSGIKKSNTLFFISN